MFKFITDVSSIAQSIIKNNCSNFDCAVDATLGNGYDTNFLSNIFKKVYAFDIQAECIKNYKERNVNNVVLINDSHENLDTYITTNIDCAMFNLGFLPGGDKSVTTNHESTILSIKKTLSLLSVNGIMTIAIYPGHKEGAIERQHVINFTEQLPKSIYAVLKCSFLNRHNCPPELIIIEKK